MNPDKLDDPFSLPVLGKTSAALNSIQLEGLLYFHPNDQARISHLIVILTANTSIAFDTVLSDLALLIHMLHIHV